MFTWALGNCIDRRGGHAAGFARIRDGAVHSQAKLGEWSGASNEFVRTAANGDLTMIHARLATCGHKLAKEAHPYRIMRDDKIVLWGMHNGIIWDAEEYAAQNDREYLTDSKELFEQLADGEVQDMMGYGTIVWIMNDERDRIYMCRMTDSADLVVGKTKCGATVWASTKFILEQALEFAGLKLDFTYNLEEAGQVFYANADGLFYAKHPPIKLTKEDWSNYKEWEDDAGYFDQWMKYRVDG